jgi:hypothetical protein
MSSLHEVCQEDGRRWADSRTKTFALITIGGVEGPLCDKWVSYHLAWS